MTKSLRLWILISAALSLITVGVVVIASVVNRSEPPLEARLPGDFEFPGTLVLACRELIEGQQYQTLAEILRAAEGKTPVLLLANNPGEQFAIRNNLGPLDIDITKLQFLKAAHESSRIGQYGPLWVERPGKRPALIDAPRHPIEQRGGQQVPYDLAEALDLPVVRLAMYVSGGNLISNGQGLAITTTAILDQNADLGWDEEIIRPMLREALGIEHLVILRTLEGEPTAHVEWFAAFTSADTVVVGRYDARVDERNADILDANASDLAQVKLDADKTLRVERIPMPPRSPGVWRSYTPIVFLSDALLVPVYPGHDPEGEKQALETYARRLPSHKQVLIDARPLEAAGVTLRSLVLRLGSAN